MNCPHCQHENREVARFCGACGGSLAIEIACGACGTPNPGGQKFCDACGQSLASEPPPARDPRAYTPKHLADKILQSKSALEGERKQVTVLFADVQGSMELAAQLDPEEWHRILERFFQILTEGVHRFEGTVNQYTGDGIMALFGAPIAHEDHAQRACHAALHLQGEIARYATEVSREHGVGFSTRMGINAGEVVVGKIGDDLRMDYTAQGHTVGLAQRMEALASPDSCYLTAPTAALVGGYFALEDLGEFRVKGVADPVRVHRLAGAGASRTRFDIARARGLSRFVGRAADLRTLDDATAQTAAGNGQVVGVVAEAGTGKSRLCFEFLERCRARGMHVFEGRAVAHGRNIPFLPILEIFRAYLGISREDDDRRAREKISTQRGLLAPAFAEALPLLFDFLGVTDPERPAPRLDPEVRQRQLLAVLRQVIQSVSTERPTITLIEDLHWMDAASGEFLARMVDARVESRNLLLLNFRPEYHADWMQQSWYRQIPLTPLGHEAIAELLADLLGADPSIAALAAPIHARTSGNPFFIEEVVRSLIESGKLEDTKGGYQLIAPVETLDVPASVHAVLAARIDRLAEYDKQLLQTAAVIGKEFSEPVLTQVLAAVAPRDATAADVAAGLRTLAHAEFVHERALYPVAEYTFKHPLTQQVAYDTLLRERRARVHAAVARATLELYAEKLDEKAALLAHHYEHAGEVWEAALWHQRAAEWAGLNDAAEGARHWERVRGLVQTLPRTGETLQLGITACLGILALGWRLGTPETEAAIVFEEGRQLAEEAGDVSALAALHGVYGCVLGLVAGASDEYARYAREAARLADQTTDQGLQLGMRAFWAFGCLFAGRLTEGVEVCDRACQQLPADPALGAEFTGYSPFLGILMAHAWMLARMGRLDDATAVCERGVELARAHGDREVLTWLQLPRLELDITCANPTAAHKHARLAIETGEKAATPQARMVGLLALGVAHRLNRKWNESVAVLEDAVPAAIGGANRGFEGRARAELATALLGNGEQDRAAQEAQTAITVAQAQHSRSDEVRAHLTLARTQIHRADAPALMRADQSLIRAQELIDETGAHAFQPELHECRAGLAHLRGDEQVARHEREEARRLYAEMGATAQTDRLTKELDS